MSHGTTSLTFVNTDHLRERCSYSPTKVLCLELLRVEDCLQNERRDRVFFARAYSALEEPHFLDLIDDATVHINRLKRRKGILQEILRERRKQLTA